MITAFHNLYSYLLVVNLIFTLGGVFVYAQSPESLGKYEFRELRLTPNLLVVEPGKSSFNLEQSWLNFGWSLSENVRGEIGVGSKDLLERAIWFSTQNYNSGLSLAYVEGKNEYFDLRAGLIQVPSVYSDLANNAAEVLPPLLTEGANWFIQRDLGVQYIVQYQPFKMWLTFHNGESGPDLDGKLWATGTWQIKTDQGFIGILSAQVGSTKSESTLGSAASSQQGFDFDPLLDSKFRSANVAMAQFWGRSFLLFEAGRGEILQDDKKKPYAWGHIDASWNAYSDLFFLARYEQTQSRLSDSSSIVKAASGGIRIGHSLGLGALTLWASQIEEKPQQTNNQFLLEFKISSLKN